MDPKKVILVLLLCLSTLAEARQLKCQLDEDTWTGQVAGKTLECCVFDGRFYPVNDSGTALFANCKLGKHRWKGIVIDPSGVGIYALQTRRGKLVKPFCSITVAPARSGPVVGSIGCRHRIKPFTLSSATGAFVQ